MSCHYSFFQGIFVGVTFEFLIYEIIKGRHINDTQNVADIEDWVVTTKLCCE